MKTKPTTIPVFKSESDEADWWASGEGRSFLKRKSAESRSKRKKSVGSPLVAQLKKERRRSDRAAIAGNGSGGGAEDCDAQRYRLSDAFEDASS
jgi:hypothetical protein